MFLFFSSAGYAQTGSTGSGQAYPAKPIRLIVPFPPGGGVDGVARIVFQHVSESLAQQVVIDNRGGSGGVIAAESAVRAAPDGYTLFFGTTATQAITPHFYRKLPYDPLKDFAPINLIAEAGYILVVHPSVPVTTVKGLVALAKAKPGTLNFSNDRFTATGVEPIGTTPGQFAAFIRNEHLKWGKVVHATGVKIDG